MNLIGNSQKIYGEDASAEKQEERMKDLKKMSDGDRICELFRSKPMTQRCEGYGMGRYDFFDMSTEDPESGKEWDMNDPEMRKKAWNIIRRYNPFMVMCKISEETIENIERLKGVKAKEEIRKSMIQKIVNNVNEYCKMYKHQVCQGRFFSHVQISYGYQSIYATFFYKNAV